MQAGAKFGWVSSYICSAAFALSACSSRLACWTHAPLFQSNHQVLRYKFAQAERAGMDGYCFTTWHACLSMKSKHTVSTNTLSALVDLQPEQRSSMRDRADCSPPFFSCARLFCSEEEAAAILQLDRNLCDILRVRIRLISIWRRKRKVLKNFICDTRRGTKAWRVSELSQCVSGVSGVSTLISR